MHNCFFYLMKNRFIIYKSKNIAKLLIDEINQIFHHLNHHNLELLYKIFGGSMSICVTWDQK